MENITQYFVPERDPWYNKGITIGEERKKREFTARLLLKSDYSVEVIAILTDVPFDYVKKIKEALDNP